VERLAHHAFRGEAWEKALAYARQAGTKAIDRSAVAQGGAYLDQALEALARLSVSPAMMQLAIDLRIERTAAHAGLGEFDRQLQCAEEALPLAERLEDQLRIALVTSTMGNALWQLGANVRARALLDRAFAIAEKAGDVVTLLQAGSNLGLICRSLGDHRRVVAVLGRTAEILTGERASQRFGRATYPAVVNRSALVGSLAELGEFQQATAVAEDMIRLAEALQQPASLIAAQSAACYPLLLRGEFEPAIPRLERTLTFCSTPELSIWHTAVASSLGYAYTMTGRLTDALPLLEAAVERARRVIRRHEVHATIYLGQAYLAAGRPTPPNGRSRSPASGPNGETRRGRSTSLVRSPRVAIHPMPMSPRRDTARPPHWPTSSGCALFSPTATSASASSTGGPATMSRPRSTSPPPRRCTARWTCGSGWSRRTAS
jgi:tetratricopeptide (TPR) repeat protein